MRVAILMTAATVASSLVFAIGAQARDLAPGEFEWTLSTDDVTTSSGRVVDDYTNALGKTIPDACTSVTSGRSAAGRESNETIVSNISYASGTTWQSTVWNYTDERAARASYQQLRTRAIARCNSTFTGLIGDDTPTMPAVQEQSSRIIPRSVAPSSDFPRVAVASSTVLIDPAKALPGYSNNFVYSIYTLVEDAVVEINVFQGEPLTSEQRSNALKAADGLAKRYAAAL